MTRKDFELIARVLSFGMCWQTAEGQAAVRAVVELMSMELARTNPQFDRARFLAVCGVETQEA